MPLQKQNWGHLNRHPQLVIDKINLSQSLELASEVTHQLGFPSDLKTALDAVAAVIDVLQCSGNHIHVVVGVHTARDTETHEVVAAKAVLARDRVAVG